MWGAKKVGNLQYVILSKDKGYATEIDNAIPIKNNANANQDNGIPVRTIVHSQAESVWASGQPRIQQMKETEKMQQFVFVAFYHKHNDVSAQKDKQTVKQGTVAQWNTPLAVNSLKIQ